MMSRIRTVLGALVLGVALAVVLVLGISGAAQAGGGGGGGGGLQHCLDQAADHDGEPPTCTKENGQWVASWDDDDLGMSPDGGFPAIFGVFFVVAILGAIGFTVWRVTTARSLARDSGLDTGLATQMALLSDNGLDATYLAANLRQRSQPTTQPEKPAASPAAKTPAETAGTPPRSAADRLAELKTLRDQGLITQTEYDARRTAIIDGV